ncbi:UDP-3-O-acyl-N-acetylglucosamine deacetylase [Methylobacterium oryzisoli]|uniref:UDP-3-O-acyl-N-acetylglucosamine deacetylase n=1 Tax=Methylobacterium oryzisoli TaxID=3385502 RepID=UPI00389152DD
MESGGGGRQSTLAAEVSAAGPGLHTGRPCRITLGPAPPDHGIRFGTRCGAGPSVAGTWLSRVPSRMNTSLDLGQGRKLRTVEHLMASLTSYGIDNALVAVDGDEIPIFDGSALRWCDLIEQAGRRPQDAPRTAIRIVKPFQVGENHSFIRGEPCDHFAVDVSTDRVPGFGVMRWSGAVDAAVFKAAIAPSRSFGNASLIWRTVLRTRLAEQLLPAPLRHRLWARSFHSQTVAAGTGPRPAASRPDCQRAISPRTLGRMQEGAPEPLLRGARPGRVAIVLGGRVLGGARFPDEPVRHRVLDLLGDLALAGRPIQGRIVTNCPTHALTFAFVADLMADPTLWCLATL